MTFPCKSNSLARFRLCVWISEGGFPRVGHLDPLRVRRGPCVVVVMPVPPLVRRSLGVTLWRVFPNLLPTERGEVEVAPGSPHRLVAAVVDEVCAEYPVAVAEEYVVAVPFIDAEVSVEAVGDGVPGHYPAHPRLQARDVRLRRAGGKSEGGVARVQMGQVRDLIGAQGAAAAGVLGPAEHSGLEEGAIDDQLLAALEQVEQANLALGRIKFVRFLDSHPRHPPAFGGQRVTRAGQGLLLHEELLVCSLPFLRRHDWGCVYREMPSPVFIVFRLACCLLFAHRFCLLHLCVLHRSSAETGSLRSLRQNYCGDPTSALGFLPDAGSRIGSSNRGAASIGVTSEESRFRQTKGKNYRRLWSRNCLTAGSSARPIARSKACAASDVFPSLRNRCARTAQ